jgi:Tfp pilus assembly protein FimT
VIAGASGGRRFGKSERRSPRARKAVSLLEVLTVLCVLSVLFGAAGAVWGNRSSSGNAEKEVQKVARWLTNLMTISNRRGCAFILRCPSNFERDIIEAVWQDSAKKETYSSAYGCTFIRFKTGSGSAIVESIYTPHWNSWVPALTIRVTGKNDVRFAIVSQHGRVRTSLTPP